jgi:hypothetical protein
MRAYLERGRLKDGKEDSIRIDFMGINYENMNRIEVVQ